MAPETIPTAAERPVRAVGVVLAAGPGNRFAGGNKLLTIVDGDPIVRHAARTFATPVVDRTVAVVGHDADAVGEAVGPAVDEAVPAANYADGQSASVGVGAARADALNADLVVYLPGDMPLVESETVETVVSAHHDVLADSDGADAVVPERDGRRGNPVAFGASQFDALAALAGDVGGRALFGEVGIHRVAVDDPGIHVDVDTRADLAAVRATQR